ncbi:hypothetical protein [Plantactinospora sp. B5E13]|uniref:hypothetical protein n=1 Tax=unclassified Plantactinospora TaxID=2631981 RepID=UPI00325EA5B2
MTTAVATTKPWYAALLSPFPIVLLGTVVVAMMLLLPIRVPAPGDHEDRSCGNSFALDIGRPQDYADDYWARTYERCTSQRIGRLAQSVGVLAVTLLATTLSVAVRRRPEESRGPAHSNQSPGSPSLGGPATR